MEPLIWFLQHHLLQEQGAPLPAQLQQPGVAQAQEPVGLAGAELALVDAAGHMVMLEKPEVVSRAVSKFVARLA